jgi:hypothetical protein
MVSTLSDGIFLRRCIQFISGGEIEHVLFTDSSSGRQLAMRQGTGKVKYLSGKILWIQDAVREGMIQLIQIPTLWNLSDIGTKTLGIQRIRLLLHGSNSLQRNEDPLICSDEEIFCVDKIRLGSVSVTCVSPLRVDMSKEET